MVYSPDGKSLAVVAENSVFLYDMPQKRNVGTLAGHTRPTRKDLGGFQHTSCVAFSSHSDLAVTGGDDGRVFARDLPRHRFGEEFFDFTWPFQRHPPADRLAVLPEDSRLLGLCKNMELLISTKSALFCVDPTNGQHRSIYQNPEDDPIQIAAEMPERGMVLVAHASGRIRGVESLTGRIVFDVRLDKGKPCCIASFHHRPAFAVATEQGAVNVWRLDAPGIAALEHSWNVGA